MSTSRRLYIKNPVMHGWKRPGISRGFCWSFDRHSWEGLGLGAEDIATSSCQFFPSAEGLSPQQQTWQMWLYTLLPLLGPCSWFCCSCSDLLQKEVRHCWTAAVRFSSLSSKNFRALATCISQQSCCKGLAISSHKCSDCCLFPDWREYCSSAHCTLYVLCN